MVPLRESASSASRSEGRKLKVARTSAMEEKEGRGSRLRSLGARNVVAGLGLRLPARLTVRPLMRLADRGGGCGITWPPIVCAVTTVPGVVPGAGVGLSERNRGWMWDSLMGGLVGRDEGMKLRFEYVD